MTPSSSSFPLEFDDGLVALGDFSSQPCLQRKRVLAFFNHFSSRTADALSKLASDCEAR